MSSDNRNIILAQQSIDDAANSAYHQQQMEQHRILINLQEQRIRMLEAANEKLREELTGMTAQRDAWKTTACALEQTPERLKTVETSDDGLELTLEEAWLLEFLTGGQMSADGEYYRRYPEAIRYLQHRGFAERRAVNPQREVISITDKGRAALAVHRASHESEGE